MRNLCFILMALAFATQAAPPNFGLDDLANRIRVALPGPEWVVVKDSTSLTLIRTNVQFLNPISLPAHQKSEDDLWDKYAFRHDYRITIVLGTKLSQAEYQKLIGVKEALISARVAGLKRGTKEFWSAYNSVDGVMRLPSHYLERFSVYFYSSDEGFFNVRPKAVEEGRDRVLAILDKTCAKYNGKLK